MIFYIFYGKIKVEMCVHKILWYVIFLTALVLLVGCGVMDGIMPSGKIYKVNAKVNDLPIDEYSIISSNAKIQPYFDNAVSGDPDVTALMIFLTNQKGDVAGWKVIYTIDTKIDNKASGDKTPAVKKTDQDDQETELDSDKNTNTDDSKSNLNKDENNNADADDNDNDGNEDENEYTEEESEDSNSDTNTSDDPKTVIVETPQDAVPYKNGDQLIIYVKNLDDDLPYFPIPSDLPMGKYALVSQVMSKEQVLHRSEKTFYFLANAKFSFDAINVHHGGITENHQLISKGTVIMLEAKLDYDTRLDPYIVWYNGKKIISEGNFSQGAGNLLWRTPEQTGFSSIRAEIFPIADRQGLAGFVKDISLLVSSRTQNMHYISNNSPYLLNWYLFEGDLNDAKMVSADRALKTVYLSPSLESVPPRWMPADGIFGLASGFNNAYSLPNVSFSNNTDNDKAGKSWKIFSRFKPLNNGVILSVQFDSLSNIVMILTLDDNNLILSLSSPEENISEIYNLPEAEYLNPEADSFLNAEIIFSVLADRITAKLNVIWEYDFEQYEQKEAKPISIEAEFINEYGIIIGSQSKSTPVNSIAKNQAFTALWDELALFHMPFVEIKIADTNTDGKESDELSEEELAEEKPADAEEATASEEAAEETPAIAIETAEEKEQTESEAKTDSETEEQPEEDISFMVENQPVSDDDHNSIN